MSTIRRFAEIHGLDAPMEGSHSNTMDSLETREDLKSILPYLPLILRSSALLWPPAVVEALKSLARGPIHSNVDSGQVLAIAISDLRNSLSLPDSALHPSALNGYALYFDDLMSRDESEKWFGEVVPQLADLLLRLPGLLKTHYQNAVSFHGMETGLRLLESQQQGIVFLSQELIAALLVCSFFCLFPTTNGGANHLQEVNFDNLFASLYDFHDVKQENKIKCIVHYFEEICSRMPMGNVSFERKVLPLTNRPSHISFPKANFWSKSSVPLCHLEVHSSGLIEDQPAEALEVDFANKCIGGGALRRGCVQEEIRFMINPELIVGMLFSPAMADNEAIEIIGTQRFSDYSGYASSFCFCGNYKDVKGVDSMGRRKTRIIAIDALSRVGKRQYTTECLLREINKAFCGFYDQSKRQHYENLFVDSGFSKAEFDEGIRNSLGNSMENLSTSFQSTFETSNNQPMRDNERKWNDHNVGIATGNWGCGAFGGDPEVKTIIQWLAASQALRPFVLYYTFGLETLRKLDKVVAWIISQQWTVGELWEMLVEYSRQKLKKQTKLSFFNWLLPSLYDDDDDPLMIDESFT
ncbi:poly(ADP-ribose) glycohydrolase 1-like isoform X1 [Olea europaea var. sylvestris]|uniref:poly(ADP-ribose) glycohydrolase 1-like isoform X1 n=1 Tax=Olea europaea var. sylvestris TaxID=158386 RepID=UPI000C1D0462|nr:poly(ADP-ribose) glycohydrolase 1-like isoform X1 [Olea europaea var. sylvestris]